MEFPTFTLPKRGWLMEKNREVHPCSSRCAIRSCTKQVSICYICNSITLIWFWSYKPHFSSSHFGSPQINRAFDWINLKNTDWLTLLYFTVPQELRALGWTPPPFYFVVLYTMLISSFSLTLKMPSLQKMDLTTYYFMKEITTVTIGQWKGKKLWQKSMDLAFKWSICGICNV